MSAIPLIDLTSSQCIVLLHSIEFHALDEAISKQAITGEDLSYVQAEEDIIELGAKLPKIQLRKVFHRIKHWKEQGVHKQLLLNAAGENVSDPSTPSTGAVTGNGSTWGANVSNASAAFSFASEPGSPSPSGAGAVAKIAVKQEKDSLATINISASKELGKTQVTVASGITEMASAIPDVIIVKKEKEDPLIVLDTSDAESEKKKSSNQATLPPTHQEQNTKDDKWKLDVKKEVALLTTTVAPPVLPNISAKSSALVTPTVPNKGSISSALKTTTTSQQSGSIQKPLQNATEKFNNSTSANNKDRERERDPKERERDRDGGKDKDYDRNTMNKQDKDQIRDRDRNRDHDRDRRDSDARDREQDRDKQRSKGKDRDRDSGSMESSSKAPVQPLTGTSKGNMPQSQQQPVPSNPALTSNMNGQKLSTAPSVTNTNSNSNKTTSKSSAPALVIPVATAVASSTAKSASNNTLVSNSFNNNNSKLNNHVSNPWHVHWKYLDSCSSSPAAISNLTSTRLHDILMIMRQSSYPALSLEEQEAWIQVMYKVFQCYRSYDRQVTGYVLEIAEHWVAFYSKSSSAANLSIMMSKLMQWSSWLLLIIQQYDNNVSIVLLGWKILSCTKITLEKDLLGLAIKMLRKSFSQQNIVSLALKSLHVQDWTLDLLVEHGCKLAHIVYDILEASNKSIPELIKFVQEDMILQCVQDFDFTFELMKIGGCVHVMSALPLLTTALESQHHSNKKDSQAIKKHLAIMTILQTLFKISESLSSKKLQLSVLHTHTIMQLCSMLQVMQNDATIVRLTFTLLHRFTSELEFKGLKSLLGYNAKTMFKLALDCLQMHCREDVAVVDVILALLSHCIALPACQEVLSYHQVADVLLVILSTHVKQEAILQSTVNILNQLWKYDCKSTKQCCHASTKIIPSLVDHIAMYSNNTTFLLTAMELLDCLNQSHPKREQLEHAAVRDKLLDQIYPLFVKHHQDDVTLTIYFLKFIHTLFHNNKARAHLMKYDIYTLLMTILKDKLDHQLLIQHALNVMALMLRDAVMVTQIFDWSLFTILMKVFKAHEKKFVIYEVIGNLMIHFLEKEERDAAATPSQSRLAHPARDPNRVKKELFQVKFCPQLTNAMRIHMKNNNAILIGCQIIQYLAPFTELNIQLNFFNRMQFFLSCKSYHPELPAIAKAVEAILSYVDGSKATTVLPLEDCLLPAATTSLLSNSHNHANKATPSITMTRPQDDEYYSEHEDRHDGREDIDQHDDDDDSRQRNPTHPSYNNSRNNRSNNYNHRNPRHNYNRNHNNHNRNANHRRREYQDRPSALSSSSVPNKRSRHN